MQEKSIGSFCSVFSINVILHVLQSSCNTIFFLTFVSDFIFSNLILAYWDILQDSTAHRNFLLGKLFAHNAIILEIKAAWKRKFRFLIFRIFRLSRLFTCYCGRLKFRLISHLFSPLCYIKLFYSTFSRQRCSFAFFYSGFYNFLGFNWLFFISHIFSSQLNLFPDGNATKQWRHYLKILKALSG